MLYAFAILALPPTLQITPPQGFNNTPVVFITEGNITAVIDPTMTVTDLEKLSESELLAVVLRHDQVISELFGLLFGASAPATAGRCSLLPLRLGTAFGSEAALRQVLRDVYGAELNQENYAATLSGQLNPSQLLKNQLQAVTGCGEVVLKITLAAASTNNLTDNSVTQTKSDPPGNLKGKAYLLAKKAQYNQTQQWQRQIETESAQLQQKLQKIARYTPLILNPHSSENLRWCVLLPWDHFTALETLLGQWQTDHPHWQITLGTFGAAYHTIAHLAELVVSPSSL